MKLVETLLHTHVEQINLENELHISNKVQKKVLMMVLIFFQHFLNELKH